MQIHNLKILPQYYAAVACRAKTFEVRVNDRNYQVGDILHLCEFTDGEYTGRTIDKQITYILDDPSYCKESFVILAIADIESEDYT